MSVPFIDGQDFEPQCVYVVPCLEPEMGFHLVQIFQYKIEISKIFFTCQSLKVILGKNNP